MKLSEFDITIGNRKLPCILGEPGGALVADPAIVLSFSGARREAMEAEHHDTAARVFTDAGHRALSFDMPHHGDRIGAEKPGIEGFRDSVLAGNDSFLKFIAEGKAAVDAIFARKLARPGRVFASGVSRGGYSALRLLAEEPRISGVAAYAPVTDWREVLEFQGVKDHPKIAALALDHWVGRFVGQAIYIAISNCDRRVGGHKVMEFGQKLYAAEAKAGIAKSRHAFHFVHNSEGHAIEEPWRTRGGEFLLELASKG